MASGLYLLSHRTRHMVRNSDTGTLPLEAYEYTHTARPLKAHDVDAAPTTSRPSSPEVACTSSNTTWTMTTHDAGQGGPVAPEESAASASRSVIGLLRMLPAAEQLKYMKLYNEGADLFQQMRTTLAGSAGAGSAFKANELAISTSGSTADALPAALMQPLLAYNNNVQLFAFDLAEKINGAMKEQVGAQ